MPSTRSAVVIVAVALAAAGAGVYALLASGRGPPVDSGSALQGRSVIVGTVRRGGEPSAARVELRHGMGADASEFYKGVSGGFFGRLLSSPLALERPAATASAGRDGQFRFTGLAPGVYEVTAIAADGARGAAAATAVADGVHVEANPTIPEGHESFACRIVFVDGRPWTGLVSVDAVHGNPRDFYAMASASIPVPVDAQGRLTATGLEPGGYVISVIEPGRFRAVSMPVSIPFDGEFVLTLGASPTVVEGQVLGDKGEPVAGAELLAGAPSAGLNVIVRRAVADAQGRFRIELPAGPQTGVFVSAPGYTPTSAQFTPPIPASAEVRVQRTGRVVGRVILDRDRTPVAGLRVVVVSTQLSGSLPERVGVTDGDGRFAIEDVAGGEVVLRVDGGRFVTRARQEGEHRRPVVVFPSKTAQTELIVVRAGRVEGVVRDPSGAAVAGAVVMAKAVATAESQHSPLSRVMRFAASDDDGRFVVDGLTPDAAVDLTANALGFSQGRIDGVTASAEAGKPVEIRLAPARIVDVSVVDAASGAPVVGASVALSLSGAGEGEHADVSKLTGADGHARLGPLGPGTARVAATHPDYVVAGAEAMADGERTRTLRITRGLALAGVVRDADGAPVKGAQVRLEREGRSAGRLITEADGRFRFRGLERGAYRVDASFSADGVLGFEATTTAEAGGPEIALTVHPPAGQASAVSVTVLDGDGKPVPRGFVRWANARRAIVAGVREGRAILGMGDDERREPAHVEVYGASTAAGAPLPWGYARVGPVVAGSAPLEVRLPPERSVSGAVEGPDGKPAADVRVIGAWPGREEEVGRGEAIGLPQATTDANGRFRIGGLGEGETRLFVRAPAGLLAPAPLAVRGGETGVRLRLVATVGVSVTVLDAQGKPVSGALVRTRTRLGDGGWGDEGPSASTDERGVARLSGFDRATNYSLDVQPAAGDFVPARRDVWAPHDETIRVERR